MKMPDLKDLLDRSLERHSIAISSLSAELLSSLYKMIVSTYVNGNRIFLAGNGGSAADAQHIAAELVGRFKRDRRALPAIALTTDTSCLTAIGNDFGFEDIFSRQIEAQLLHGDLLWLLSVSGSSPNIVKAAEVAKQMGGYVILFTGKNCSSLLKLADASFVVDDTSSDVVQECHQFAYHFLCDMLEQSIV